ncbi:hypothetical protein C0J52_13646 [Blattella germanica]|nr:hypothetical protein C0J52_13646 [Blattella germanica]
MTMDDQTALILALQLIALCCIAAALLLYLLCRIRNRYIAGTGQDHDDPELTLNIGLGRPVLGVRGAQGARRVSGGQDHQSQAQGTRDAQLREGGGVLDACVAYNAAP